MQSLIGGSDCLGRKHEAIDQEQYFLASEELLEHIAPVALCKLSEHDLLVLHHPTVELSRLFDWLLTVLVRCTLGHRNLCLDVSLNYFLLGLPPYENRY